MGRTEKSLMTYGVLAAFGLTTMILASSAHAAQHRHVAQSSSTNTTTQRYLDPVFSSVSKTSDTIYGQAFNACSRKSEILKLDFYQPIGDTLTARPVVILAHGGGFKGGDKGQSNVTSLANGYAKRGFVALSINYRLCSSPTPQARQQAAFDFMAAIRWARATAATYRLDGSRVAGSGTSAGADTAIWIGFDPSNSGTSGNPGYPSDLQAVISISGTLIETPSLITAGDAPMSMHHGTGDTVIPYPHALATCNLSITVGNVCEMNSYPGAGHSLSSYNSDILEKSSEFLHRALIIA